MNDPQPVAETPAPAAEATPESTPTAVPDTPVTETSCLDSLPQDLRDNPTIKDTPSVEALAKRLVDTKAMVGNSLRVPGEHATQEDWTKFRETLMEKDKGLMPTPDPTDPESLQQAYKALGLPEEPSGYTRPENWTGMDDERFGFLSAKAHEAGLSKRQFEKLANEIASNDNQVFEKFESERQGELNQLKGEWGNAYEQKTQRAVNIAKQLDAPEKLMDALNDNKVDAATFRWLDGLATKLGNEGNGLIKDDSNSVSQHTPTELKAQMAEITNKMMTMDTLDPNYKVLMDKRIKLAQILSPE